MLHGLRQPLYTTHSKCRARWSSWTSVRKPSLRIVSASSARAFSKFSTPRLDENKLSQVSSPLQQPTTGFSNTVLIHSVRSTIHRLLARCNTQYKVVPFDHAFYQQCFDEATQRGYPVSSEPFSVPDYLRVGVIFGATAGAHGTTYGDTTRLVATGAHNARHALRIWIALYTTYATFVDDTPKRFPQEMSNLRAFNDRFVRGEKQGNAMLEALADLMREAPSIFGGPVPANLVTTSILDFITATMIEVDTQNMQISAAANQYPSYQRVMSGIGEAYAIMAFPPDIPFEEYIQAMPDIALFICTVNDVLSFYKEELAGESTNHVATIAARKGVSRVEAFEELADTSAELYERIVSTLGGEPRSYSGAGVQQGCEGHNVGTRNFSRAREAFEQFVAGYVGFHTSLARYRLTEVGCELSG
ncbi:hypothetical protein PAXRUDRAFT_830584 [Paxillus rubicundulus Ve08.2h10]|uniref:Terpene synthase n=1 Tax=Paxillus rubicundulus Ve08.2h10 TaxID=930991 RepID=A0A0D0DT86_9AGAM|nr:hypothetical protein PAXRUDRAFT_830584 [Paxillus rubicundulus Ve08.2h10]